MWKFLKEQQQRGSQLHTRADGARQGEAPAEAVAGRSAQDHDYADLQVSGGEPHRDIDYPATEPPEREGDITPSAPEPQVEWDEVVQPERRREQGDGDLPLPEGK